MMSSEQEDWVRFHLKNRSRKNNIRVRISNLERMKNCMEEQRKPERHRPVRELVSWCLYLVAVFPGNISADKLCRSENESYWFFHGEYVKRWRQSHCR